jgi:alpha-beta hydrolase superfamily lysophospholipase
MWVHGMSEHGARYAMGSFVDQTLIGEHGAAYRGVVLSGSNGPPGLLEGVIRLIALLQRRALGGRAPGMWTQRLVVGSYNRQFAPTRTPSDWLSRDSAEVDRFRADPLCGTPLTAQSWLDFVEDQARRGPRPACSWLLGSLPLAHVDGLLSGCRARPPGGSPRSRFPPDDHGRHDDDEERVEQ